MTNSKIEQVNLCRCNNCNTILLDNNPSADSKTYDLNTVDYQEMEQIKEPDGEVFWGCPVCQTDDYLMDL